MDSRYCRTAFILGAGLGIRLRPLTERRPKPLLPLGGRPIITYAMDHAIGVGVERFIVNTHHCPEAYHQEFPDRQWRGREIVFRHEPALLDTAGGLKNIEDLLDEDDSILCYNGDIVADFPLSDALDFHRNRRAEATLVLRSAGPALNVELNARGEVCDLRNTTKQRGARSCQFTGVYMVEKSLLAHIIPGKVETIVNTFIGRIAEEPGSVAGIVIDEGQWCDIGSIEMYERMRAEKGEGR